MKKTKTLLGMALVVTISFMCFKTYGTVIEKKKMNELLKLNIEALTEGEEGTRVGVCYTDGGIGAPDFYIECDGRTSAEYIFPCHNTASFIKKGVSSLCTK